MSFAFASAHPASYAKNIDGSFCESTQASACNWTLTSTVLRHG